MEDFKGGERDILLAKQLLLQGVNRLLIRLLLLFGLTGLLSGVRVAVVDLKEFDNAVDIPDQRGDFGFNCSQQGQGGFNLFVLAVESGLILFPECFLSVSRVFLNSTCSGSNFLGDISFAPVIFVSIHAPA